MANDDQSVDQPLRIGVDGYNIAMPRGTGVATYGRALCETLLAWAIPSTAFSVSDVPRSVPHALREILFFGALSADPVSVPPKPTLRRLVKRAFLSPLPRHLVDVPRTGHVVAKASTAASRASIDYSRSAMCSTSRFAIFAAIAISCLSLCRTRRRSCIGPIRFPFAWRSSKHLHDP